MRSSGELNFAKNNSFVTVDAVVLLLLLLSTQSRNTIVSKMFDKAGLNFLSERFILEDSSAK